MVFDFAMPHDAQLLYRERETRYIIARTLVQGRLELQSPTLISNGDSDLPTDMALLRDLVEARALIPGSSIAGALRAYLKKFADEAALFGDRLVRGASEGEQSSLLVSDAISTTTISSMVRDGVQIDKNTRVARDGAKYDLELLPAGTCFDLYFELLHEVSFDPQTHSPSWQTAIEYNQKRLSLLGQALYGLESGQIALGMRKQRGLGQVQVTNWQIWHYRLTVPEQMHTWLLFDRKQPPEPHYTGPSIRQGLGIELKELPSNDCQIQVEFGLDQSLLIRSANSNPYAPDDSYLQTRFANGDVLPVIPGTSWAGIIRHRAEKILATLTQTLQAHQSRHWVKQLFGYVLMEPQSQTNKAGMSRVRIQDSLINIAATDYIQTRITLDRFTGGAYPGALLAEQPVWGKPETTIKLELRIEAATEYEIGLILLVIKDLWLGDLTVGGEQSIGRGVLSGRVFRLSIDGKEYGFSQADGQLVLDQVTEARLQAYVSALLLKEGLDV